jgi:demethylmenaquinone methyltransferase/2-methoxy-6-polyprenyl-1,4-benzoquinol methylase
VSTGYPNRIDFFETLAPYYDASLDLLTLGLYARFIKDAVSTLLPQENETILDLCSGTGRACSWIARHVGEGGLVIGMDISKQMVKVARDRYGDLPNVTFLQKDATEPWGYRNYFDGIFTSFSLHELSQHGRLNVLEQSFLALKHGGRMVIADFNPDLSGKRKILLRAFFRLFERENLDFFCFEQRQELDQFGFQKIEAFSLWGGLLQITHAQKVEFAS